MKSKIARLKSARKIRSKLSRGDLHRLTVYKTGMHTYVQIFSPEGKLFSFNIFIILVSTSGFIGFDKT